MITFVAIPVSPRGNKISDDGGGLRITLELDEQQFAAWTKLAALRGKLIPFTADETAAVGET